MKARIGWGRRVSKASLFGKRLRIWPFRYIGYQKTERLEEILGCVIKFAEVL